MTVIFKIVYQKPQGGGDGGLWDLGEVELLRRVPG